MHNCYVCINEKIGAFRKQFSDVLIKICSSSFPFLMHEPALNNCHVGDQNPKFVLTANIVAKMGLQINKK